MENTLKRIHFAQLPTPVTFMDGYVEKTTIRVKRDDLTHFLASGNKIRKLEYLLQDAVEKQCGYVVTCGGIQSNHCRATAVLCREIGLKPVLFLRGQKPIVPEGNLFIDQLLDTEIHWITPEQYEDRDTLMQEYKKAHKEPERVYVIPEGGSNALGSMGYANAVFELNEQIQLDALDAIFIPVGSGGTYAGILAGLEMLHSAVPVFGINVTKTPSEQFTKRIAAILADMENNRYVTLEKGYEKRITVLDSYVGEGYAIPTEEAVKKLRSLVSRKGLLLDPVYTSKAFVGLLDVSKKNRFENVLFWHTGGGFGVFAYADRIIKGS
jgi:D-cysteine desulfhydrase